MGETILSSCRNVMRHWTLPSALALLLWGSSAFACGYHPGLANAKLDAAHPKSLSVAVAIRRATGDGLLDTQPKTSPLPTFASVGYQQAVHQLRVLEGKLSRLPSDVSGDEVQRFALVFVRSRLWARYAVGPDGATAIIHTSAAEDNETVVLTDESVLTAIADGHLAFDTALDRGLLQFANDPGERTRLTLRAAIAGGDMTLERTH